MTDVSKSSSTSQSAFSPTSASAPSPASPSPPPRPRWPGLCVRALVAPAVLMVCLLLPVAVFLLPGLNAWVNDPHRVGVQWLAPTAAAVAGDALTAAAVLGVVALFMRHWDRRPFSGIGWNGRHHAGAWFAAMVGVGTVVALVPALVSSGPAPATGPAVPPTWVGVILALGSGILLQAVPEETLFRGWFLQSFGPRRLQGLVATTALFTVMHLVSSGGQEDLGEQLVYLLMPLGFGFTAAVIRIVTGSLWGAVGVHTGIHVGFLAVDLASPGFSAPWWWVVIGCAWAAVGAGILVWNRGLGPIEERSARLAARHGAGTVEARSGGDVVSEAAE